MGLLKSAVQCQFVSPWMKEATKIFMQIFFVVSFLCFFFFLYVVKVEKDQFVTQIDFVVDNIVDMVLKNVDQVVPNPEYRSELGEKLKDLVDNWQVESQSFKSIQENNDALLDKTKFIVINYAVILLAVVVGLFLLHFCNNMTVHLMENLVVVFFIGLTEFLFLRIVASQYISADPNKVKYVILDTIERFGVREAVNNPRPSSSIPQDVTDRVQVWREGSDFLQPRD